MTIEDTLILILVCVFYTLIVYAFGVFVGWYASKR